MSVPDSSLTGRAGASHRQTRFLLFAGFGGLLLLMGVLGVSSISFLYRIEIREERIRREYVNRSRALETLRSDIYLSGTNLRDFLLAEDDVRAVGYRKQFLQKRSEIDRGVAAYRSSVLPDQRETLSQLQDQLERYFSAADSALIWTSPQRFLSRNAFMREQVIPMRTAALGLADRLQQLSEKRLEISGEAVAAMLSSFRAELLALLLFTLLTGLALAGAALWRLLRLENESQGRFREVLATREELKRLSGELVSAQEDERRSISRELHDEVGQVLSAIVYGIENLRSALHDSNRDEAFRQLQLVQDMTERNVSVVRNISLLLRPTMLDDLGLAPALKWLAREVSRNSSIAVDVLAGSFDDDLPEEHRTCVFRVVQEAVRNAARHSSASRIRIYLHREDDSLRISIQDDGKGFSASHEPGLGILGMKERVTQLQGQFTIDSKPRRGTIVSFTLPLLSPSRHQTFPHRVED